MPFATFTNRGTPDNAVLTNNGMIDSITWINEAGATVENNAFWQSASGGRIDNAGTININAPDGALLDISGVFDNTGTFNNAGMWVSTSNTQVNSGDLFNLAGGSIRLPEMTNSIGGMVDNAGTFTMDFTNAEFTNEGDIVNSGAFRFDSTNAPLTDVFSNTATGTVTNQSGGNFSFLGGAENRGAITNQTGGTMTHDPGNGARFTILGGQFDNAGTFDANSRLDVTGAGATVTNTGTFNVNPFSDVNIINEATFNNQTGGTLVVNGPLQLGFGQALGGTLNNAGTINQNTGFSMNSLSTLNNESTGTYNLDTVQNLIFGGTVNNAGIINLNNPFGLINLQGAITNQPGATFNLNGGGIFWGGAGVSIDNAGTVNLSGGGIVGNGGRYTQTAGSTIVDTPPPALIAAEIDFQGGTLTGTGTVETTGGPVTNTGASVEPGASAGTLTITGDYTQGPNGAYVAEIGGLTPDTEHDVLVVTGDATLAGRLEVRVINGFVPQLGDTFEVLQAGVINGEFDQIVTVGFPLGLTVDVEYTVDTVTLTVDFCNSDTDGDGVCDTGDICPGGDDNVDTDADDVADFCDPCPMDNPDDANGDGLCDSTNLPANVNPNGGGTGGETVPGTECCGGGVPMMMPFMLMGWTWKRRRNRRNR